MSLSDILTVPFLVSLGITLLLVGILGIFFVQRLQEQNHKMASMLGLVSTMAEELNFIRGRLQMMSYVPQSVGGGVEVGGHTTSFNQTMQAGEINNLIPVSDGDDTDSDSDGEEDDSDVDNDDASSVDTNSQVENTVIELNPSANSQTIKIINFGELNSNPEDLEQTAKDLDELEDIEDIDDIDDIEELTNSESEDDTDTDVKNEKNSDEQSEEKIIIFNDLDKIDNSESSTKDNLNFIKSIDISNLEEHTETETVDYKKMSMAKLRNIAIAKGLMTENSKATKNAIIKMLGSE
jgi:hypothetical protein